MKRSNNPAWFLLPVLCSLFYPARVFAFNAHQPFDIAADVLDFVDGRRWIYDRPNPKIAVRLAATACACARMSFEEDAGLQVL